MKWAIQDILAVVFFIILAFMVLMGHNGMIIGLLGMLVGYYFGDKRGSVILRPGYKDIVYAD